MNRFLILLFSIFLIGCFSEPKFLNNGLTKNATKITEYIIKIEHDSLNNEVQDTLSITEKKYNDNDQIVNRIQKTLIDNNELKIDYIYDNSNNLKTEIVKMSTDSLPFTVDYIYKDSVLHQTKAIVKTSNEIFEQVETYYYRKNKTKEKTITTLLFINLELSDTLRNSVSKSCFDKNEVIEKIETVHPNNTKRNIKTVYEYDCSTLIGLKHFDQNDSLLNNLKYEYKMDEFDNWIIKNIIRNDKLDTKLTREIKYK